MKCSSGIVPRGLYCQTHTARQSSSLPSTVQELPLWFLLTWRQLKGKTLQPSTAAATITCDCDSVSLTSFPLLCLSLFPFTVHTPWAGDPSTLFKLWAPHFLKVNTAENTSQEGLAYAVSKVRLRNLFSEFIFIHYRAAKSFWGASVGMLWMSLTVEYSVRSLSTVSYGFLLYPLIGQSGDFWVFSVCHQILKLHLSVGKTNDPIATSISMCVWAFGTKTRQDVLHEV